MYTSIGQVVRDAWTLRALSRAARPDISIDNVAIKVREKTALDMHASLVSLGGDTDTVVIPVPHYEGADLHYRNVMIEKPSVPRAGTEWMTIMGISILITE